MRKLFFSTLLLFTLITSAFASDVNKVSSHILNKFETDFRSATNITWTVRPTFSIADFELDGKKISAYYDLQGELLGTAHSISIEELPTGAKRTFAKKFNNYTVKEALKYEFTDETAYVISAAKDNETVMVKVGQTGYVEIIKKIQNQ